VAENDVFIAFGTFKYEEDEGEDKANVIMW